MFARKNRDNDDQSGEVNNSRDSEESGLPKGSAGDELPTIFTGSLRVLGKIPEGCEVTRGEGGVVSYHFRASDLPKFPEED